VSSCWHRYFLSYLLLPLCPPNSIIYSFLCLCYSFCGDSSFMTPSCLQVLQVFVLVAVWVALSCVVSLLHPILRHSIHVFLFPHQSWTMLPCWNTFHSDCYSEESVILALIFGRKGNSIIVRFLRGSSSLDFSKSSTKHLCPVNWYRQIFRAQRRQTIQSGRMKGQGYSLGPIVGGLVVWASPSRRWRSDCLGSSWFRGLDRSLLRRGGLWVWK